MTIHFIRVLASVCLVLPLMNAFQGRASLATLKDLGLTSPASCFTRSFCHFSSTLPSSSLTIVSAALHSHLRLMRHRLCCDLPVNRSCFVGPSHCLSCSHRQPFFLPFRFAFLPLCASHAMFQCLYRASKTTLYFLMCFF